MAHAKTHHSRAVWAAVAEWAALAAGSVMVDWMAVAVGPVV